MSILDRLKSQPPWKDPDPLVRIDGIDEIPDDEQDLLVSIAREDEDARVRQAAAARLRDPSILTEVIQSDSDADVKTAAGDALLEQAIGAEGEPDEIRCLAALEGLTEELAVEVADQGQVHGI